jgi:hypothetical protein
MLARRNFQVREIVRLSFVICSCCLILAGCQLPRSLTKGDLDTSEGEIHVRSIRMINGTEIDFRSDSLGYAVFRDSAIVRTLEGGRFIEIPVDSIQFQGSTRYPKATENAFQNLLIVGGSIAFLLLLGSYRIVYH